MSAVELLEQAQALGVLLVLDDGRLTWEADHEPPGELLEEIRTHRLEIIEALSEANDPSQPDMEWLARLAVLLCCTPDYLLEDFKKLKELYDSTEKNHDLYWDMYWEGVEASIKAAYLDGTISQADALQLFARYGITECI